MNVTQAELISIIEAAGVTADVSKIQGSTKLTEAGIDSLEMMNVFLGVEQRFGVKIPDEEIDALGTIDQIVDYLKKI